MRGLPIALLCLALGAALPVPVEAQDRPGVTTVILPHNLARSQALANEAYRHDRAVAHINQNQRQLQLAHKRRLEDIDRDDRLDADARARRIADENQRFDIDMRGLERQHAIAEQQHAVDEAKIRADHPEPGDREQFADRFDAEGSMTARAHAVADEDMRHERQLAHIDENQRAREGSHRRRMKDINGDNRLPADGKAMEREEENEKFAVDLRHIERQRRLADEDHANRRAAIDARFGNPNTGSDVFAAGDRTPPAQPGQAQPNDAPAEGGVGGAEPGGKAVTGPSGRPPRQGGTDQAGTGAVGQPVPGQPPVVLKGRVEETVGAPPPSQESAQLPCEREFDASVPTGTRFTVGLSDGLARCVEGDVALLPVAPVAVLVAKYRLARVAMTAATRFQGADSLLRDLKKQRPADECAYDTGAWYAQVICDTQALLPLPSPKPGAGPHPDLPAGTARAPDPPPLTPEQRARQAQQRQREAQTRGAQAPQDPPAERTRDPARAQDDAARAAQQRARQQEQRRQQASAQRNQEQRAQAPQQDQPTPEQRAQDQRARDQQQRQREQAAVQRDAQRPAEPPPGRQPDSDATAIETGPVCGLKEDCFWRAMRNASGDPAFERLFDGLRPESWREVYDTLKQHFGGRVPGVTSASHANGIPEKMSFDDIIDHLKDKEGAEGIVFVHYTNGESHALNVANFKRRVVFIDDQKQFWPGDAPYQTVEAAVRGTVAYTKFYRTR